jgi:hypothetical protein
MNTQQVLKCELPAGGFSIWIYIIVAAHVI